MAHHSGMALLAFTNALLDNRMPRRMLKNALCEAHDLLLQERVPQAVRPVDPEELQSHRPAKNVLPGADSHFAVVGAAASPVLNGLEHTTPARSASEG